MTRRFSNFIRGVFSSKKEEDLQVSVFRPPPGGSLKRIQWDRISSARPDPMRNERLVETLAPFLEAEPALAGFVNVGGLTWMMLDDRPVHPILRFVRMKGATLWGYYGLSVDFVPLIDRKRAVLRPAPKGAKLDIGIDPSDHDLSIQHDWGPDCALEDASCVLPAILKRAAPFWSAYRTVADLAEAARFADHHEALPTSPGVQQLQSLAARPFLFAAAGDKVEAERRWAALDHTSFLNESGARKLEERFRKVLAGDLSF